MKKKLIKIWRVLRVWFGFGVWVRMQYNRPKYSLCVFHGRMMKRERKTEFGAFYHCPLCKRSYHLQSLGNKMVPV